MSAVPSDVATPKGGAWLARAILGYLMEHPGAPEDRILKHVDEAAGAEYVGVIPSLHAERHLYELVKEGTLRWGAPKGHEDRPLRYWVSRRTAQYLCCEDEDECQCEPVDRAAAVTVCENCGASMPEFDVTDHRASRPFEGEPLPCPGADPFVVASETGAERVFQVRADALVDRIKGLPIAEQFRLVGDFIDKGMTDFAVSTARHALGQIDIDDKIHTKESDS